jgi:hypothetical protein
MTTRQIGCTEMDLLAPELALGTLTGPERAEAIGHLASCAECQQRAGDLAQVVDSMLVLAPEEEPSDDFEARVLARTIGAPSDGGDPARRPSGRRRLVLAGSLAAALVAVVALAAWFVGRDGDPANALRTAVATEEGSRAVCRAVINEVDPAWLFVSLDEPGEARTGYDVEVRLENGEVARVGRIEVRDGHGALAVTLDLGGSRARSVRLIGAGDEVGYEARFL